MTKLKNVKKMFCIFAIFGLIAMLSSCFVDTVFHKVAFKINGEVVDTVLVEKGQGLKETQLPEVPTLEDYAFEGWYNGEVLFDESIVYNEDTTYEAKLTEVYTVTFKVEEETVKSVKVKKGEKVDMLEVPTDPSMEAFEFVGWYNGEEVFDETKSVYASATYTAKFVKTHYVVVFEYAGYHATVLVKVGETLSMETISSLEVADAYFAGWYSGDVVASEGMEVSSDMVFAPKYVTVESFNGTWCNENGQYFIIENGKVFGAEFSKDGQGFVFDPTTGKLGFDPDSYYYDVHSFEVISSGIKYVHKYYDATYEEMTEDVVEVYAAQPSEYVGNYRADSSSVVTIIAGGIVTEFNGSKTITGIIKEVEGQLTIVYMTSVYQGEKTVNVSFDEKGNMVVGSTIYVKNPAEFSYLYNSYSYPTFNFFKVNDEVVVTVKENSVYYYGSVEGVVAVDEIITVTYNGKSITCKAVSATTYELAGEEQGTYSCGESQIVLNGFGDVVVKHNGEEETGKYVVNGNGVVVIGSKGYAINKEAMTYEVVAKDSLNNGKFVLAENSKYTLVLDGFGGATLYYASSYSNYEYNGKYVVKGNEITISNCQSYANGKWTVEENGNVLAGETKVYILEGASFEDKSAELDGVYGEEGFIVVNSQSKSVKYNGETYTLKYNYNGSKATFEIKHVDSYEGWYEATFTDKYTISKTTEGNLKVYIEHSTWDEYGEGAEITTETKEYAPYVSSEKDAFAGTWVGKNSYGSTITIVINGDGSGTYCGGAFTYTITGNKLSFSYNWEDYSLNGDPSTGKVSVMWTYDYSDMPEFDVVREDESESNLDAFAGTWVGKNSYGSTITIVINGDGSGTYCGGAFTYTITGNKLSFSYNWEDYSLNGDPSTGKVSVMWTYDYSDMPEFDVVREDESESNLDAFAGTWVGKNSYGSTITIVINGDGSGTYCGGAFTYTITGNKLSFSYNWEDYSLNGDPSTGKVSVMWTYDYSDMPEFTAVRQ